MNPQHTVAIILVGLAALWVAGGWVRQRRDRFQRSMRWLQNRERGDKEGT